MYHWIRDCAVPNKAGTTTNMTKGESLYLTYHFLRVFGWSLVWECDGVEDNHVSDGSMEDAGTSSWTEGGGLSGSSKITTDKHMGERCLSMQPDGAGQYIQSADITTLESGEDYQLTLWVKLEEVGTGLEIQVNPGTGSYGALGTINGSAASGWRRFDYNFTESGGGTANIRLLQSGSVPTAAYLVDSVFMYKSWFEYNGVDQDYLGTTDGEILNDDEFSSSAYTFLTGDIGKFIAVKDGTNLGNSGVYKIDSINAGNAVLDLRAGGTPTLTAQASLPWRMLDVSVSPAFAEAGATASDRYAGFILESPHTSKWRWGARGNYLTFSWIGLWNAPYDADFDVDSGNFYGYEHGTHNVAGYYAKGDRGVTTGPTDGYIFNGSSADNNTASFSRLYLQTDDDSSFIIFLIRIGDGTYVGNEGISITGFSGVDSYHPLRQSFVHFSPSYGGAATPDINFINNGSYFSFYGCQCSEYNDGLMQSASIMVLGYLSATADEIDLGTNYRINPFDSAHWLRKFKIARDYNGTESGNPTEKTIDTMGIFHGPTKDDSSEIYTAIDSNSYLYLREGVYLELPGSFEPLT